MSWTGALVVYVIIWWLVVFMVLPWGNRAIDQVDVEKGQTPGAPRQPRLAIKFLATTAIATALWGVAVWLISSGLIGFRPE